MAAWTCRRDLAAAAGPAGSKMRRACRVAGRIGAIVFIFGLLAKPVRAGPGAITSHSARPAGEAPAELLTLEIALARQILLQVAQGDIGQVTDFEAVPVTSTSRAYPVRLRRRPGRPRAW